MEQRQFDHLTKVFAARGTRRGLVRGLTGVAAGALAAVGLGHEARFARALQAVDSQEQSVMLFEGLAAIAHEHVGSCEELRDKLNQFRTDHAELLAQHKTEQDAWTREQRVAHADAYADRRRDASTKLLAASVRCGYSATTPGEATPGEATPVATPVATLARRAKRSQWVTAPAVAPALLAAQECNGTTPMLCVNYTTHISGPIVNVPALCGSDSCSPCVDSSYCAENYPDICPAGACSLVNYVAPNQDCCQQSCPISTSDCTFDCSAGIVTPSDCDRCECSWCGSTSDCMTHCEDEACCNTPCSSTDNPDDAPPMGGE